MSVRSHQLAFSEGGGDEREASLSANGFSQTRMFASVFPTITQRVKLSCESFEDARGKRRPLTYIVASHIYSY